MQYSVSVVLGGTATRATKWCAALYGCLGNEHVLATCLSILSNFGLRRDKRWIAIKAKKIIFPFTTIISHCEHNLRTVLTRCCHVEPKKAKRTHFPSVPRPALDLMSWHQLPISTRVLPVASEVCACQETQPCKGKGIWLPASQPQRDRAEKYIAICAKKTICGKSLMVTILNLHQGRARSGL